MVKIHPTEFAHLPWVPEVFLARFPVAVMPLLWLAAFPSCARVKKNPSTQASTHRVRTLHSSRLCWFLDSVTTHILSLLWNTENYFVSLLAFFSLSLCGVSLPCWTFLAVLPSFPRPHAKKTPYNYWLQLTLACEITTGDEVISSHTRQLGACVSSREF